MKTPKNKVKWNPEWLDYVFPAQYQGQAISLSLRDHTIRKHEEGEAFCEICDKKITYAREGNDFFLLFIWLYPI